MYWHTLAVLHEFYDGPRQRIIGVSLTSNHCFTAKFFCLKRQHMYIVIPSKHVLPNNTNSQQWFLLWRVVLTMKFDTDILSVQIDLGLNNINFCRLCWERQWEYMYADYAEKDNENMLRETMRICWDNENMINLWLWNCTALQIKCSLAILVKVFNKSCNTHIFFSSMHLVKKRKLI